MDDLRMVAVRERHAMSGGGIIGTIGIVVGASALIAVGYYIVSKFYNQVDTSGFTAEQNSTFEELKDNSDDAFEISSFMLWVFGAVAVLTIVLGIMAALGN